MSKLRKPSDSARTIAILVNLAHPQGVGVKQNHGMLGVHFAISAKK
ncbi:MAG TPA: hypothetical protein VJ323_14420 [Bryobacteraceae bacterium]|jgi:hypothetical protein|nr:hypothetical protein [Bryobacteraceae bacterium]